MKKKCIRCKDEKFFDEFYKSKRKADGYDIYCKSCSYEQRKIRRDSVKRVVEKKVCGRCKQEKIAGQFHTNEYNTDGLTSYCKACRKPDTKSYYNKNKKRLKTQNKKWVKNNKEYMREYAKKYYEEVTKKDTNKIFAKKVKSLISMSFKNVNIKKPYKTEGILGCTIGEFKKHIESQFLNWMEWGNYGNCETNDYNCSWHLDHIIPLSVATNEEEVLALNHWSNFQPLCSKINTNVKKAKVRDLANLETGISVKNSQLLARG